MWLLQSVPSVDRVLTPNPAITFFVVVFGVIWLVTNLYGFYPLVQTAVEVSLSRLWPFGESEVDTDTVYHGIEPPTIDLFIPAYEEANVIEQAIQSACSTRYPDEAFQVSVLLEPDDDSTHQAVADLQEHYEFDVLTVPEEYPGSKNKPRALNYGFEQTDGDVVTIIDAEDIVPAEYFHEVARSITDGADFGQARPDMANEDDGWLNLMFRAEYGFWYNLVVPSFENVGYPIPLGGTSCYFSRSVLETVSEHRIETRGDHWPDEDWEWIREAGLDGIRPWDPQNVTEDFELGLLLWELDYQFGYLDATIIEESPTTFATWLTQRTRWKKGKIYTMLDRLENPPASYYTAAHVYWQSFLPHLGPVNIAGVVVVLLISNLAKYSASTLVGLLMSLGLTFIVVYSVVFAVGYAITSDKPPLLRARRTVIAVVTIPLHWLVQWSADLRAIYQVYLGNLHWEDTDHEGRVGQTDVELGPSDVTRPTNNLTLTPERRWIGLGAVVVLAGILRWFRLGRESLWTDELYSIAVRGDDALSTLVAGGQDPHPPLYYLLLNGWTRIAGTGVTSTRSLSVIFGLATVVAVYLLATELFDDRTGLTAALLVAVSAFFIHYSRMVRMYSLVTVTTALSWYWFARLREQSRRNTVGYLLTTVLLLYTHVYGLFVLAAQHVYVVLSEVNGGIESRRWLRIQFLLGILVFPWLAIFSLQAVDILFGVGGANISWIPDPTSVMLTNTGLSFVGYPDFYPFPLDVLSLYVLASTVLFVYVGQFLASLFQFEDGMPQIKDAESVGQLSALILVVIVTPFLISLAVPIYVPRYATPASIGVIVLSARGLRNVPLAEVRAGFLAVIVISSLVFVGVYYTNGTQEPWSDVSDQVKQTTGPGDIVVHQPDGGYAEYYYRNTALETATIPSSERVGRQDLAYLQQLVESHDAIFLVQYNGNRGPAVGFLSACHDSVVSTPRGAITLYQFGTDTGCPSVEEFLGEGSNTAT
jgi:cellulose synthase/poly-beta-1,6-N-acetylglucosamine synthase-like glycosyltransferase